MLNDEATVLKSVMIRVNPEVAMLVTRQYHTEKDGKKIIRSQSRYRWIARVFKTDDLVKAIKSMREDANRLNKFRWPDDPWPWYIACPYPENSTIADWLCVKLRKIKTWEDGQKVLAGWKNKTKNQDAGFYENSAYKIDGYLDKDGKEVSLSDIDAVLAHVNQNLVSVDSRA